MPSEAVELEVSNDSSSPRFREWTRDGTWKHIHDTYLS